MALEQAGAVRIVPDSPDVPDVRALLEEHLADMRSTSPPESVHALPAAELSRPGITLWSARDEAGRLLGCGALTDLGDGTAEIKSMRTVAAARGRGVGAAMLAHIVGEARRRGCSTLLLETGTQPDFAAARRLYARAGFTERAPFGSYALDPHSAYFELRLHA